MRESRQVPEAEFSSYYGRPVLKRPAWKTPDVPIYLFLGGMAGASAVLAEGAALTDRPALERTCRVAAAAGATGGTVALVHDLGRPERFLYMLRVFKPTSPLSVGSWILAPFSGAAVVAAGSALTGRWKPLGRLAGVGAALLGPPLATYTAALVADTAIPVWHEAHRELPFVFVGSAALAAGSVATAVVPADQAGPARRMMLAGVAVETVATELMNRRLGWLADPYRKGRTGRLMKAARWGGGLAAAAGLLAGRSRTAAVLAGVAGVAGSQLLRFAVFEAGIDSADDPEYTVRPQRERLERREARDGADHARKETTA